MPQIENSWTNSVYTSEKVCKITAQTIRGGDFWGAVTPNMFPLLRVMDLFVNLNDKKCNPIKNMYI